MIITCPCGEKKFEVDSSLIPEKGKLLQCGSCDKTWFFKKNEQVNIEKEILQTINDQRKGYQDEMRNYHAFLDPFEIPLELNSL